MILTWDRKNKSTRSIRTRGRQKWTSGSKDSDHRSKKSDRSSTPNACNLSNSTRQPDRWVQPSSTPPQPFVWQWPGKWPLMYCENCNPFFPPKLSHPPSDESSPQRPPISAVPDLIRCCYCDREADPELRFCPMCGSASRSMEKIIFPRSHRVRSGLYATTNAIHSFWLRPQSTFTEPLNNCHITLPSYQI
ncbi:hypothetical protein U1Q18_028186, partial [Sarracenia purpurea var. burkii]